jgi:hypothetical protein
MDNVLSEEDETINIADIFSSQSQQEDENVPFRSSLFPQTPTDTLVDNRRRPKRARSISPK